MEISATSISRRNTIDIIYLELDLLDILKAISHKHFYYYSLTPISSTQDYHIPMIILLIQADRPYSGPSVVSVLEGSWKWR